MKVGELQIPKINIEPFAFIHDFQTLLFVQYADIVEKTEAGRTSVQMLSDDPRVIALKGKMISRGSGAQIFEVKTLAMWFLWCANEYGLESAKNHLNSFLNSENIAVINVLWVLGIEVDKTITLLNGYNIQSIKDMPDSRDKENYLQYRIRHAPQTTPVPACAIIKSCHIKKVWTDDQTASIVNEQEFWDVSRRLYDIALLLNTVSGISCLPYYSTSYTDPTIPFGPFGGSGGGSSVYDVLGRGFTKIPAESKADIDALIVAFDKLNDSERSRIQRILNRLSQAKRRTQIEDKILDLGITIEMLLLDDNRNNEQLSLTFRLRGSWLLGKSAKERVEIYEQLKEIYTYRSQVAHSGVLCKGNGVKITSVRKSFSKYQYLAEEICRKIIKDGIPDWNGLVLNAI